jgi:chitinase
MQMSYDLHGIWDSNNPIGSIVQAHTNLTEIKLAAELFWRAKVPPSKLALGFGFYGRAFTLADPSCTTPGCPFKGGAKPGACTDTSGCTLLPSLTSWITSGGGQGPRSMLT